MTVVQVDAEHAVAEGFRNLALQLDSGFLDGDSIYFLADRDDVGRLGSFLSLAGLVLDARALGERPVALTDNVRGQQKDSFPPPSGLIKP